MSNAIFKSQIASYLRIPSQNISLFWKGRVALYAILKAIGIKERDEVILPAFTCVVAVNPIIYLGARPIYVDIDPKTYNIDVKTLERVNVGTLRKAKAILAQNTFGLSSDLDAIFEIAKKYNLFVIEDCAHGFGGFYKERPNGTIADASFFSTQWNKPFSTGLGGIAVTRTPEIAKKLRVMEETFIRPSIKDEMVLKTLFFVRDKLGTRLYWPAIKTYRWLSKNNLILGSSQGEELERPVKPEGFEKGFSWAQAKKGRKELERFNEILEHRKKVATFYRKILLDMGIEPPYEPDYAEHTYLKFPLLVKDRMRSFRLAEKERIELGDWFLSPIHPITKNLELWHYRWGENPVAENISRHIVNLPTHLQIDEDYVVKIAEFLKRNRENII
ncbi:MAG: DegT/DnrJ/EryC1/StrS family aminotransferase [Sedimentibacter sp.]|nr:DegT/DnrJ/EryC1/StrS family aminotransferase [Sedimentibacter sp.]